MRDIFYINRETGKKEKELVPGGKTMYFLYGKKRMGKLNLYLLFKRKYLSQFGGLMMNWSYSKRKIAPFVDEHEMDMNDYIVPIEGYKNFNQFFYRKLQDNKRPIGEGLVSPADGKIVVFEEIPPLIDWVYASSLVAIVFVIGFVIFQKYEKYALEEI